MTRLCSNHPTSTLQAYWGSSQVFQALFSLQAAGIVKDRPIDQSVLARQCEVFQISHGTCEYGRPIRVTF